ncbi:MAG: pyridoxamine 5'-phosphate oxidase family protein [Candidatus Paceibacterota bacterium]|jgi:hypothetical protein
MNIPDKVRQLFNQIDLVAFGTSDKNGMPNVVPVFWKKIKEDGTILLIDNFMKATKGNLLENSNACVSFWNSQTEEAYKLRGEVKYHTEGKIYEMGKSFIQEKKPDRIPKGVVEFIIKEIYTITPGEEAGSKID